MIRECLEFSFKFIALSKKLQTASLYDTDSKYRIWISCYYLISSYADNQHTHRWTIKNQIFEFRGPKTCIYNKNWGIKIRYQNIFFILILYFFSQFNVFKVFKVIIMPVFELNTYTSIKKQNLKYFMLYIFERTWDKEKFF